MVKAHKRGHEIIYIDGAWVYFDTRESITILRPCKRCNQFPTPEGHDYCLGFMLNVKSACCGHGVEKPYVILNNEDLKTEDQNV